MSKILIDWTSEKQVDGKVVLFGDVKSEQTSLKSVLKEFENIPADMPNLNSSELDSKIEIRNNKHALDPYKEEIYKAHEVFVRVLFLEAGNKIKEIFL